MKCPSCYEALATNATYCSCGWRKPSKEVASENVDSAGRERQCSFMVGVDDRCPNLVTFFPGNERKGFCQNHVRQGFEVGVACPPEIREQIYAFLRRSNVSKGPPRVEAPMREPGEEG